MDGNEINELRDEIASLKKEIVDLKAVQDSDRANTISSLNGLYTDTFQYIADIHDYLWPMFHKLFPKFADEKQAIDAFLMRHNTTDNRRTIR